MPFRATPIRRWARRTTLALILGALSTIAVAWTLAALPIPIALRLSAMSIQGERAITTWQGRAVVACTRESWRGCTRYWGWARLVSATAPIDAAGVEPAAIPPPWLRPVVLPWYDDSSVLWENSVTSRSALTCGWPFHAVFCAVAYEMLAPDNSGPRRRTVLHGLELPPGIGAHLEATVFGNTAVLPTHPLWPGFLADALLFALPWLALLTAPPALRRTLRRRRGHCPNCNYNRLNDFTTPCPECGSRWKPGTVRARDDSRTPPSSASEAPNGGDGL